MIGYISKSKKKRDEFVKEASEFSLNKKSLMILADIDTNTVVMTYKGLVTAVHNKGTQKTIQNLVILKPDDKEREKAINQFLSEIDGMLWALSEQFYKNRLKKQGLTDADIDGIEKKLGLRFGAGDITKDDKAVEKEATFNV